jgi:hypothetical protein
MLGNVLMFRKGSKPVVPPSNASPEAQVRGAKVPA